MRRCCQTDTARSKDQPFFKETVTYEKRTLMSGSWHKTVCAEKQRFHRGGTAVNSGGLLTKRAI